MADRSDRLDSGTSSDAGDADVRRQPLTTLDRLLRVSEKLVDLAGLPMLSSAPHLPGSHAEPVASMSPTPPIVSDFVVENKLLLDTGSPPAHADGPQVRPREVIGDEDRQRVGNTLVKPFCWVCQILSSAPGSAQYAVGTGAFIGPRTILTAAHNLYVKGRRADKFYIYLALNGDRHAPPLDSYEAVQSEHHPDYNDAINFSRFDVALVHIDNPLSSTILNTYGIMPFVPVEPSQWEGVNALVTGYPKDYPKVDPNQPHLYPTPEMGVQAFQYYCISPLRFTDGVFKYTLDTTAGQSGAPLIASGLVGGQSRSVCIGVHVQGNQGGNMAIPLDQEMYSWVLTRLTAKDGNPLA